MIIDGQKVVILFVIFTHDIDSSFVFLFVDHLANILDDKVAYNRDIL